MRVYSLIYRTPSGLKTYIANNQLDKNKKYLVKIHSDALTMAQSAPLLAQIKALLPKCEIIGCNVGGVIYKGQILDNSTLISIVDLYETQFVTTSVRLTEKGKFKSPKKLTDEILYYLGGADDSFIFMFYCPMYPAISQVVEEMNSRAKNFKMIGGGAYSEKDLPYIIHNEFIASDYVVAAKLEGRLLLDSQATITGIRSVGRAYTVTKSNGHRLSEIDGKPAKEWINYIVGEEYIKKDPTILNSLPLIKNKNEKLGLNVIYDKDPFTGEELGSDLFVYDEVRVGEELTAGYIDPSRTATELKRFCSAISSAPTEALFAYSCMTRRYILHNCAKWELSPFCATQITGAFMAGELVYDDGCKYANSAFTVASLSEDKIATVHLNTRYLKEQDLIQFDNLPLVNYLFSTAESELKNELSENRQRFAEQLLVDNASGLPNLTKFMYDSNDECFDCVCLLTIKNESIIKVFLKNDHYLYYIEQVVDECRKSLGSGYRIYRHGELSVLIAATPKNRQSFISNMQELKARLDARSYENYRPIFEMSIVLDGNDLLNRAEQTYLTLHKGNLNMLINYGEDENSDFKKEMVLLQVVNDAISYKRVIPFYQGIMNNRTGKIEICESLMRIADKEGQIYMPTDFLPVAKQYKLYEKLSQMMIERVLDEAPSHPFAVSVNLNISDIYNQEILDIIFEKLKKMNEPQKIIFEIVESEEITDYDYMREFTGKIHSLGAKIAIDDFGSGYSNLMHILRIDLDYLKITGEIVKELCTDKSCQEFVSMISNWANVRNKKVVAEFVENDDIQSRLKKYNVNYSQGYLFSRPKKIE